MIVPTITFPDGTEATLDGEVSEPDRVTLLRAVQKGWTKAPLPFYAQEGGAMLQGLGKLEHRIDDDGFNCLFHVIESGPLEE